MPTDILYPPTPWNLRGEGLMVFTLKPRDKANKYLPQPFISTSIIPNKTPSGFYIAKYSTPLTVEESIWHEWGDVWAYAKSGKQQGYWIREMAVDSEAAMRGGIQEWGINKLKGDIEFDFHKSSQYAKLSLTDGGIELQWKPVFFHIPFKATMPFLTQINNDIHTYIVKLRGLFQLCRVEVIDHNLQQFISIKKSRYWGMHFIKTAVHISDCTKSVQQTLTEN